MLDMDMELALLLLLLRKLDLYRSATAVDPAPIVPPPLPPPVAGPPCIRNAWRRAAAWARELALALALLAVILAAADDDDDDDDDDDSAAEPIAMPASLPPV